MSHVLVFLLILALLSSGRCRVAAMEETHHLCIDMCPPGYYSTGICSDPSGGTLWHTCNQCGENTFTQINNTSSECQRCNTCGNTEQTIRSCTRSSNVVCDCKPGYYNQNPANNDIACKTCRSPPGINSNDTDYKKKCPPRIEMTARAAPVTSTSTTAPASSGNTTAVTRKSTASSTARPSWPPQHVNHVSHFVWLAVVFAVMLGLLLLKKLYGEPARCPYWRVEKGLTEHTEAPRLSEQRSHSGNASTTLTINECEETPMMTLSQSPSTPEHPAPVGTLPPHGEPRAVRQDEQSNQWPAIVLYAIIKEVPLRRWKEFLRLLSVSDEQLERIELEAGLGLGSMERQYLMLKLWSQRATASLDDIFSALHYMDLSRCAQVLQESLENLQSRAESRQDFPA